MPLIALLAAIAMSHLHWAYAEPKAPLNVGGSAAARLLGEEQKYFDALDPFIAIRKIKERYPDAVVLIAPNGRSSVRDKADAAKPRFLIQIDGDNGPEFYGVTYGGNGKPEVEAVPFDNDKGEFNFFVLESEKRGKDLTSAHGKGATSCVTCHRGNPIFPRFPWSEMATEEVRFNVLRAALLPEKGPSYAPGNRFDRLREYQRNLNFKDALNLFLQETRQDLDEAGRKKLLDQLLSPAYSQELAELILKPDANNEPNNLMNLLLNGIPERRNGRPAPRSGPLQDQLLIPFAAIPPFRIEGQDLKELTGFGSALTFDKRLRAAARLTQSRKACASLCEGERDFKRFCRDTLLEIAFAVTPPQRSDNATDNNGIPDPGASTTKAQAIFKKLETRPGLLAQLDTIIMRWPADGFEYMSTVLPDSTPVVDARGKTVKDPAGKDVRKSVGILRGKTDAETRRLTASQSRSVDDSEQVTPAQAAALGISPDPLADRPMEGRIPKEAARIYLADMAFDCLGFTKSDERFFAAFTEEDFRRVLSDRGVQDALVDDSATDLRAEVREALLESYPDRICHSEDLVPPDAVQVGFDVAEALDQAAPVEKLGPVNNPAAFEAYLRRDCAECHTSTTRPLLADMNNLDVGGMRDRLVKALMTNMPPSSFLTDEGRTSRNQALQFIDPDGSKQAARTPVAGAPATRGKPGGRPGAPPRPGAPRPGGTK